MPTSTEADEHPIIFNGWSIRRILAGEKTQTRRLVKPQPPKNADRVEIEQNGTLGYFSGKTAAFHDDTTCPYGQPSDVLWVREAFRLPHTYDKMSPSEYVNEGPPHIVRWEADEEDYNAVPKDGWGRLRPSIHMPRELCRLRLCVEDVRVERVQEINAYDADSEGIEVSRFGHDLTDDTLQSVKDQLRQRFYEKWNDIHGDGAWEENPWVWVVEFSRIDSK